MATVCDVVPLYGENRSIVRRGLAGIHQTGNIGLNALIKHLDFHKEIRAMDLGFRSAHASMLRGGYEMQQRVWSFYGNRCGMRSAKSGKDRRDK